jgi:hypothetical protein
MYFEIYKKGKLIKRGDEFLGGFGWDNELMYTPSTSITLPIEHLEYISGREEMKVFTDNHCFWGIVTGVGPDKEKETVSVSLTHVVSEWDYRKISINNAIKDKKVNIIYKEEDETESEPTVDDQLADIYADTNFAYPGWKLDMTEEAANTTIDYVYSKQGKLEALTKTMELTEDLFWRVRTENKKRIEISKFGDKQQYIVSEKPSGVNNVSIISAPKVESDFKNVVNLATVYSDKSDSGMSSLTLREVYERPSLQTDGFPCVILRSNVNNERDYSKYITQYPILAPNNELEYAVIDEESVALEGGTLIEDVFNFNDLSAFQPDEEKEITDEDRIRAAKTAYDASVRKLKLLRRSKKIRVETEPIKVNPGDMVRFLYDNSILKLEACTSYEKKILSFNDWFYVTHIRVTIDDDGSERDELTLEKYLKIDRE